MEKRMVGFLTFLFVLFALLMIRVVYLATSPELVQTAATQSDYTLTLSSSRAEIYDRNFNSFVNRGTAYRAVVLPDPACIDDLLSLNDALDRNELAEKFQMGKPFVVDVNSPYSNNESIQIFEVPKRYTDNSLAPHIIGYLDGDGEGVTGIEASYNDYLNENGEKTLATCTVNGVGEYLKGSGVTTSSTGSSQAGVVLTLDKGIQDIVEHVGEKYIDRGAVVVLDAQTAEIVASASFPSFSQNNPAASMNDEVNTPMNNRVLQAFNVGSTFKIATAAAALDNGCTPERTFNCTGSIEVAGQIFHCHNHAGHGVLNMQQALQESCNPYFISLGLETGADKIRKVASDMGFGKSFTLADGITSSKGYFPGMDELQNPGDVANFSFGQGDLTATPLQVSELLLSVCNHGQSIAPSLVQGMSSDGRTVDSSASLPAPIQVMSEKTALALQEMLAESIANQPDASFYPKRTTAGGKSATAQTGKFAADGSEIYQVWYTGFFPADEPEYIVTILVEGGTSGSADAGPVFAEIADLITEYQASSPQ